MNRAFLTTCICAGGLLLASVAAARPGDAPDQAVAAAPATAAPAGLMKLWSTVGKCVVGRDRPASIAFVRAPAGSDDAVAAARRLDPVFAGCLAGSRVPGPSSVVLRRAALAEALGFNRPRI